MRCTDRSCQASVALLHHFDTCWQDVAVRLRGPPARVHIHSAFEPARGWQTWPTALQCRTVWWAGGHVSSDATGLASNVALLHHFDTLVQKCDMAVPDPFEHTARVHLPTKQCGTNAVGTWPSSAGKTHVNVHALLVARSRTATLPSARKVLQASVDTCLHHFHTLAAWRCGCTDHCWRARSQRTFAPL